MWSEVHPIRQARMAHPENCQGLVAAAGKAPLFPNVIQATWIAAIAQQNVLAADPEPTGNPNVDGIRFR